MTQIFPCTFVTSLVTIRSSCHGSRKITPSWSDNKLEMFLLKSFLWQNKGGRETLICMKDWMFQSHSTSRNYGLLFFAFSGHWPTSFSCSSHCKWMVELSTNSLRCWFCVSHSQLFTHPHIFKPAVWFIKKPLFFPSTINETSGFKNCSYGTRVITIFVCQTNRPIQTIVPVII